MGATFLTALSAMQSGSSRNKQTGGSSSGSRQDDELMRFLGDYGNNVGFGRSSFGGGGSGGGGTMDLGPMFLHRDQQAEARHDYVNDLYSQAGYGQ